MFIKMQHEAWTPGNIGAREQLIIYVTVAVLVVKQRGMYQ